MSKMIDISDKTPSKRTAVAEAIISMSEDTLLEIINGRVKKGDVLQSASTGALLAIKRTPTLIPHCHPVPIDNASVEFNIIKERASIGCLVSVSGEAKTGYEMEALVGASTAALIIYDMCKYMEKGMQINSLRLLSKTGGKSGDYSREE